MTRPVPASPLPAMLGKYEILRLLTRGATADVYLACRSGFPVALKVLRPEHAAQSQLFADEAWLTGLLCHPNIATLYEVVSRDGWHYMALELVQGLSLHQLVSAGPVPVPVAAHIADRVLLALEHAHDRGIVHRDVSCANVLCSSGGYVKLIDFGAAAHTHATRWTFTGPAEHTAPEQRDGGPPDVRGDVYSAGVLLAGLITGRLGAAPQGGLPPAIEPIVRRATRQRPEDRYHNAAAMRAQVSQVPARKPLLLGQELSHLVHQRSVPRELLSPSAPPPLPSPDEGNADRDTAPMPAQAPPVPKLSALHAGLTRRRA